MKAGSEHGGIIRCMALLLLAMSPTVLAGPAVFTGTFDGSEAKSATLEGNRPECGQLPYIQSNTFQVSTTETYRLFDANFYGLRLRISLYNGSFNPADVAQNRVQAFVDFSEVSLQSGKNYVVVVQPRCYTNGSNAGTEGAFGMILIPRASGSSGTATGGLLRPLPPYMTGVFTGSEPSADIGGGNLKYQTSGPFQVPRDGKYGYVDLYSNLDFDMTLGIYGAPFNASNPLANQLYFVDDGEILQLQAGKNYYFVTQSYGFDTNGQWLFTLSAPREFFLNPWLNGSWFNPDFPGQGFFLDVFPGLKQLFLAWFTYDVKAPVDPDEATVGYSGARWLTAFGDYHGAAADLAIELTEGGRFHDPQPVSQDPAYGTLHLEFQDCENGTVEYGIPSAPVDGSMPIQRISNDNVDACKDFTDQPWELLTN